jgi:hypothetical protein
MTTIGYGDFHPVSNGGRVVGVLVCLWGVLVISIFVHTLNNMLRFTPGEVRSFNILSKL